MTGPSLPESERGARARTALRGGAIALVAAAALAAYAPSLTGGFLWDDDFYVTGNRALESLSGLSRIWTDPAATPQYYPMTHTTFWVERRLFGLDPTGYRVVNLALHLAGAWLFLRILERLRVPGAPLAAAVFALHPVHVESVAWITERKNVLSGALALASLAVFLPPALDGKGWRGRRAAAGALAALLFAGAVLSKTVVATLPIVAALLLVWKRGKPPGRTETLALAAAAAAGAALGLLTVHLEQSQIGAVGAEWSLGLLDRVALAGRVLWFYLGKLAWPAGLCFVYPRWNVDAGRPSDWIAPALVVAAIAVLLAFRRKTGNGPLVAAAAYGILLFPALGFFNVYPMRYSWVADHFQYHASLPALALACAACAAGAARLRGTAARRGLTAAAVAVVAALAAATWSRSHAFADLETLWRDTLARNPSAWMAHNNLGGLLAMSGREEEAIPHVREAIRLKPDHAGAHDNLGRLLARSGQLEEAIAHLREAVRLDPGAAGPRFALARALEREGRSEEAIACYLEGLSLSPRDADAQYDLGTLLARSGRLEEALPHLEAALRMRPDFEKARRNLALARKLLRDRDAGRAP